MVPNTGRQGVSGELLTDPIRGRVGELAEGIKQTKRV